MDQCLTATSGMNLPELPKQKDQVHRTYNGKNRRPTLQSSWEILTLQATSKVHKKTQGKKWDTNYISHKKKALYNEFSEGKSKCSWIALTFQLASTPKGGGSHWQMSSGWLTFFLGVGGLHYKGSVTTSLYSLIRKVRKYQDNLDLFESFACFVVLSTSSSII